MQSGQQAALRQVIQEKSVQVFMVRAGEGQAFITLSASADSAGADAAVPGYAVAAELLSAAGFHIVHERIFCSLNACQAVEAVRKRAFASAGLSPDTPVTCVQGHPLSGDGYAGTLIHAVRPTGDDEEVRPVMHQGVPIGSAWTRRGASFIQLQAVHGLRTANPDDRGAQALQMFDDADAILRGEGAAYADVARTWLYLSDILDWYGDFNAARNDAYARFGFPLGPGDFPASTGIRGDNPQGAAGLLDLLAVTGNPGKRPKVKFLSNPRQQDAFLYGSAFSRGASIREADVTRIEISGTAAIDARGASVYPGSAHGQVAYTFDNIKTLIGHEGAGLGDIAAATAFFKHPQDVAAFRRYLAENGLTHLPAVCVLADVCRDDLLFELDGVATLTTSF